MLYGMDELKALCLWRHILKFIVAIVAVLSVALCTYWLFGLTQEGFPRLHEFFEILQIYNISNSALMVETITGYVILLGIFLVIRISITMAFLGILATVFFLFFLLDVSQGNFPIAHMTMEGVLLGNFSENQRIAVSAIWYAILLGILVTAPLFIASFFEKKQFHQNYKIFWWVISPLFSILTMHLYFEGSNEMLFVACVFAMTLFLTVAPAAYQNKVKRKSPNTTYTG